jgi:PAS domain S-box-containing protein
MDIQNKTKEEFQKELTELRQEYNSLKELYDKENSMRKFAYDEKLETNLKLTLAMQGGHMAWWEMDVPTGNVTFDKNKVEMLGYPSENFTHYKDFMALVHPKDLKRIINAMKGHLDGTLTKYEAEYRILASSGEYIWFYDYGSVIKRDSHGAPLICSGFVFNISDRKNAEFDLLKIIKAIEFTSDAIAIADSQGRHFYQNKALSDLLGYETAEETEAAGGGMARIKDRAIAKQMFKTILHGKSWSGELELVTKSGRVFPAYERADAIKDKEGKIIGVIGIMTDISERKKAEELLLKSENMLQMVLDNFPGVVFWKDRHSNYLGCNQSFASGAGLKSPAEIVGKTDLEMPWALTEANNYLKDDINVMEHGKERRHIIETQHQSDGKLIWFDTSKFPLRDSMGQVIGVVGVSNDISTLRKAEQTLKESEVKFRQIFDLSPIGIVLTGLDKKFLNCNQAFAKMLGYSTEEIVGLSVDEITFPEDRLVGMSEMKALIEGEVETMHIRKRYVRKDKQILWAELTISLIRNSENDPLYYLANIQDITKIKETEEERDLIIAIIEQSSDFIGTSDMQGNLLYHNPAAKAILGMSANTSLLGMHIKDICSEKFLDLVMNEGISTATRNGKWQSEIALKHFDGHEIPVSILQMVHKDKEGIPVFTSSVMRDITNLKLEEINLKKINEKIEAQNEEYFQINEELAFQNQEKAKRAAELIIANKELLFQNEEKEKRAVELIIAKEHAEQSDRLKSAFLTNMSHEIRTPMNGILGFASILKEVDLSGEERLEFLELLERSGNRMLNIINDLVDISKIESGQMEVHSKESNINDQIDFIHNFFKPEVDEKRINFSCKKSLSGEEAIIHTDREKVYAILTNLVKNAIKYTDEGSIEFGYNLKKVRQANVLEFFVKDTGIGIPKGRQEAIFERFIKADMINKMARQGAGLGLSITKAFVELLGGKIWVESEEENGSTFYFTIPYNSEPIIKSMVQKVVPANDTKNQINPEVSGLKILIVEDEANSEMVMSINVKKISKEVKKARTGNEAVEICRINPDLDLILMDIQMPGLNGYEATRQIRQFNKDVVIIAQTAFALSGDREKAIEAGCNDYITKPINKAELLSLIQKYFKKIMCC